KGRRSLRQYFPAITICPYNKIKCSYLQRDLENCYLTNCSNLWNIASWDCFLVVHYMRMELYGQLQQTDRQRIGMEREVMVKLCTINHSPCSGYFDAQTINTVSRGNCFGFNYNGSFQVRAGPEEGMSLEFFLARNESVWHSMNNKVGLRVVLHQPNEVPLIEELGRDVFPGSSHEF
ncbi:hypothetical protein TCAL_15985, partial [Tigriopus californicus]